MKLEQIITTSLLTYLYNFDWKFPTSILNSRKEFLPLFLLNLVQYQFVLAYCLKTTLLLSKPVLLEQ